MPSRRGFIIGAVGVAAGSTRIVRAEASDLIEIPYEVHRAKRWAVEEFNEMPSCRLVFENGDSYRWFKYNAVSRPVDKEGRRTYAVAIEVATTDRHGHRSVHTIPVDGVGLDHNKRQRDVLNNARAMLGWLRDPTF